MDHQKLDDAQCELESPSWSGTYLLQVVAISIVLLAIQLGLLFCLPIGFGSTSHPKSIMTRGPLGSGSISVVLPGAIAVFQNEVWVNISSGPTLVTGTIAQRSPSSKLIAIDTRTGTLRDTGIELTPSPLGLLVVSEQLCGVSEYSVVFINSGKVIRRTPRRTLVEPTAPFLHEGRLAVIDKSPNNTYSLLRWVDENWVEMGPVQVPAMPTATRYALPELRILTQGEKSFSFYSDGLTVNCLEGFVPELEAVSALRPENWTTPLALADPDYSRRPESIRGWKPVPFKMNGWGSWRIALVENELQAYCNSSSTVPIQKYHYRDGRWIESTSPPSIKTLSFGVANGDPGYLVTSDLKLYSLGRGNSVRLIGDGIRVEENSRDRGRAFDLLISSSISTVLLIIGITWLMKRSRTSQYVYGKREAFQATVVRRAIARMIDTLLTLFLVVASIGTSSNIDFTPSIFRRNEEFATLNALACIFGLWMGSILLISVLEGYWGVTPGKWIAGIRTYRTTLRPCGFLRAFVREMMVYADSLCLICWIPGVLSIACTRNCQRLGDLVSDTVVVLRPQQQNWYGSSSSNGIC